MPDLHKCFRQKNNCDFSAQAVARMKCHQITVWKMAEYRNSDCMFSEFVVAISYFPCCKNHLEAKYILQYNLSK